MRLIKQETPFNDLDNFNVYIHMKNFSKINYKLPPRKDLQHIRISQVLTFYQENTLTRLSKSSKKVNRKKTSTIQTDI